ncbi:Uu.00g142100.m01.CDS01 [Anthostomella pinea]|uniref:Uu.00g142100.m01.CDS01 n=1 Tax=Anthostomella pinea TaxID=933095 RepID=A0AAI8YLK2_9PEZI|nr:Uu.00g142100.m01.CDS01 [Anthostomella pinea]
MPGFFDKIQARFEIYRLEQRYTRNRHRRSTFISNAMYVDGEYVYQTPSTTGSSTNSSTASSPVEETASPSFPAPSSPTDQYAPQTPPQKKRSNRLSAMPGFGSLAPKSSCTSLRHNGRAR